MMMRQRHWLAYFSLGFVLTCWCGVANYGLSWLRRPMGGDIYGDAEFSSCLWWIAAWILGIPTAVASLLQRQKYPYVACLALVFAIGIVGWNHFLWELAVRVRHLQEYG
jgi:mannose/fructose/N-acetylgalactosamine-specific phosphotransferase system component IIC